ncbi:O-antigen ligase family protein [Alcaligenes nematophilus]|uniref:O-antigen ligase family protein n=1 Tax=Alcaligenes nematophilus TaxID=2994643 RepID=A0ABU3MST7_9BURK|nr:O-antigen ligase family protein [Alcaligenes nematophilus]MDT8463909.1 O-antigen ligase family protein [Alcaligenes nematophilus]MDT8468510.1 O-antigen ligase family protein [Alcaligenes nematophilus]MDT8504707.1 O-antigen ligase family protein [Alcaligenes nematophilus]MDT8524931.1 O-antigen ligase family protein [Alcaligenes nematophilus]
MQRPSFHFSAYANLGINLGFSLFFASILSTRNVYAIAAGLLLVSSLALCFLRSLQPNPASSFNKGLHVLLLLIFLNGLAMWLYHGDAVRQLDLISRYLLLLPILYALSKATLKPDWISASFALGSLSSLWLVYAQLGGELHNGRVYGYTGAIQFGNIALLLGLFCLTALLAQWHAKEFKRGLASLYALGALAGLFASLASGSRGGWIALPLALAILIIAYTPKRYAVRSITSCVLAAILAGALLTQNSFVQERYQLAAQDITQFQEGNANTSIGARLAIWQANWELIKQRPIVAWSDAEHQKALEQLTQNRADAPIILGLANSHNNYIETWLHFGISGLFLLVSLFVFCFFNFIKNIFHNNPIKKQSAINGSILVVVYSISNLTQNMMERNNTLLFFLLAISIFWSLMSFSKTTNTHASLSKQ